MDDWKMVLEMVNARLERIESKVDSLDSFMSKLIGASLVVAAIVSLLVQVVLK